MELTTKPLEVSPYSLPQVAMDVYCRQNLSIFTAKAFGVVSPEVDYIHNWHIDLICEHLLACYNGDITRLIINIPPRLMKSICTSVALPAWLLGKNPSQQIMAASYSYALSVKHSRDCRLVMQSDWYKSVFPDVQFSDDSNTQHKFTTTKQGHRIATSVGGSTTGEGADWLIADDIMQPNEAMSLVQRQTAIDWFEQVFLTRRNNPKTSKVIIIMQRLHEDDLTGHLLKKGGWEHLCIPNECEQTTTYSFPISGKEKVFKEGELLSPLRIDTQTTERYKQDLGSYAYSAQYQQRPAPAGGGMVKKQWFNYYNHLPEGETRIIQSWDTAYKDKQINDPSCGTTWLEWENKHYLLDMVNKRMQYPELKQTIISYANTYQPDVILIEDKASGQSLIQEISNDTNLPIVPIKPEGDKITRASTCTSLIEAGKVLFPANAGWLFEVENQLLTFPNASHDDIVDSITQYLNYIKYMGQPQILVF